MNVNVAGIGTYVPRYRITADAISKAWERSVASGIEEVSVPDADEDTLTMAYEAVTSALEAATMDGQDIDVLTVGTTTPPIEEGDIVAKLVSMVGAPDVTDTRLLTGSTRAGADALSTAIDSRPDGGLAVAVATDAPRGKPDSELEHAAGAASTAIILADEGAGQITERSTYTVPYPGIRFRRRGNTHTEELGIKSYDRSAYLETIGNVIGGLGIAVENLDAVAVQAAQGKLPYRIASKLNLGVTTDQIKQTTGSVTRTIGNTGASSPLVEAAYAINDGSDSVLIAAYGSGAGGTAFVIQSDGVPVVCTSGETIEISYTEYLRLQGEITTGEPSGGGAYVSVPSWRRTLPQRYRLVVGRCPECGALNFQPEGPCRDCAATVSYERVQLSGSGTVEAVTTIQQGGAPPEFVEQQAKSGPYVSAIVEFNGPDGRAVSVPTQATTRSAGLSIGDHVEATIRRIYHQEGVIRYGIKVESVE